MLARATGSLAIPHNDAWAYSRIAESYAAGQGLHLLSWNRVFLVGQIAVLGRTGSIAGQHTGVSVLAVCGLAALFLL